MSSCVVVISCQGLVWYVIWECVWCGVVWVGVWRLVAYGLILWETLSAYLPLPSCALQLELVTTYGLIFAFRKLFSSLFSCLQHLEGKYVSSYVAHTSRMHRLFTIKDDGGTSALLVVQSLKPRNHRTSWLLKTSIVCFIQQYGPNLGYSFPAEQRSLQSFGWTYTVYSLKAGQLVYWNIILKPIWEESA